MEILPEGKSRNFSLSPDETKLAYTTHNGQQEVFVLRDIASSDERSVIPTNAGENAQSSEIFWSADGNTAVFTLVHGACLAGESSSIVRVDTVAMTATSLVDQDERRFSIVDWPNPARKEIRLADKDGNVWLLELDSGKLSQGS